MATRYAILSSIGSLLLLTATPGLSLAAGGRTAGAGPAGRGLATRATRQNPGYMIVVGDLSPSTVSESGQHPGRTVSWLTTGAINDHLTQLIYGSLAENDGQAQVKNHTYVGVATFGRRGPTTDKHPQGDPQHVEWVHNGPLDELMKQVKGEDKDSGMLVFAHPVTEEQLRTDPKAKGASPIKQVLTQSAKNIREWKAAHPDSTHEPVVVLVTDGMGTEMHADDADGREYYYNQKQDAMKQAAQEVVDAGGRIFVVRVANKKQQGALAQHHFPHSADGMGEEESFWYHVASPLTAAEIGMLGGQAKPGARALLTDPDMNWIRRLMVVGTRSAIGAVDLDSRREHD
jgi:hypothetical protein